MEGVEGGKGEGEGFVFLGLIGVRVGSVEV